MRRLEVRLDWGDEQRVVGTLAEEGRRLYFEYDSSFIDAPLPISPFKLPVRPGLFEHTEREFARVFGVFNDSLPDGWGLLLMDREFRKRDLDPRQISVLDRLAYMGMRGMGCLTYHPADSEGPDEESLWIDLDLVAHHAERILEGSVEEVLPELLLAGGSPGGARPKILVGVRDDDFLVSGTADLPDGFRRYLIKFPAKEDPADIGVVELAYARMAETAGIDMPATRVFETHDGGRYFGAERFDRDGNLRLHMHTLGGLLHASHRMPSLDYDGLLLATLEMTKDHRQMEEAFRRMVFNVLAHNRDDHVKNFSYLMDRSGVWKFSPAYDLVFSAGPGGEHTMAIAGEARTPSPQDMLRVADACDLPRPRAKSIIEQVREATAQWARIARETGVEPATEAMIAKKIGAP
jgi:serine/threonine-protein kinase HipA